MKSESPNQFRHLIGYARRILAGHPLACLFVALVFGFALVTLRVLAQQTSATASEQQLETAIVLFQSGDARQAQALFAAVNSNEVTYAIAEAYNALCRYEICRAEATNDYSWFLEALKSPTLQPAALPPELEEALKFNHIEALYKSRMFGGPAVIPLIDGFQRDHPGSVRSAVLAEYEMAAWFERGMQRLFGASLDETKRFHKTWTNGVTFLEQFLSLTKVLPGEDYSTITDRSLAEDVQVALALLSQEPSALTEIPIRDAVNRQRYDLIRVALHQKVHPEQSEQNLQLFADAASDLQKFPASRERARMKRQLARFAFRTGERFCFEAAGTALTDTRTIANKRTLASQYFQAARAVHGQMAKMDWSYSSPTDTALFWTDLYNSYFFERNYSRLMEVTTLQLTNSATGSPKWLAAKLFQGVALNHQSTPQPEAAAAAFDEVMSYGMNASAKRTTHDHLLLFAARWRVHLAVEAKDPAAGLKVVQWVEQSDGDADLKAKFLRDHRWVAKWEATSRN